MAKYQWLMDVDEKDLKSKLIIGHSRIDEDKLKDKIRKIKLLITDVDGVLTDGSMYYGENENELKRFHTYDGLGLILLRLAGMETILMTSENVELVRRRAKKLKFKDENIFLGEGQKIKRLEEITNKYNINKENIAYVGDYFNDLEIMENVGLSIAPSNAHALMKTRVDYTLKTKGGEGALTEAAELILFYQGRYKEIMSEYLSK